MNNLLTRDEVINGTMRMMRDTVAEHFPELTPEEREEKVTYLLGLLVRASETSLAINPMNSDGRTKYE